MDDHRLLTTKDLADYLGVSERTLEGWRVRGGGPNFIKTGRLIRYSRKDVECWLEDYTRRSTSGYEVVANS